jgi:hypothetical protein
LKAAKYVAVVMAIAVAAIFVVNRFGIGGGVANLGVKKAA